MTGDRTSSDLGDALPTDVNDTDPSGCVSNSGTTFCAMLNRLQKAFHIKSAAGCLLMGLVLLKPSTEFSQPVPNLDLVERHWFPPTAI